VNLNAKHLAALPNLDKNILCNILGEALRLDHSADELPHARVVVFKHNTISPLITLRESLNDCCVDV
jgi:hypothetical protein